MRFSAAVLIFLLCLWCVTADTADAARKRTAALACTYQDRAVHYEKKGDLHMARNCIRVAETLLPGNMEIGAVKSRILRNIQKRAGDHYGQGRRLFAQNKPDKARREFLIALRYDPAHDGAREYLYEKLRTPLFDTYTVRQGDSLKTIAGKVYKYPEKDFIIAYFNNLKPGEQPKTGTVLRLPVLDGGSFSLSSAAKKDLAGVRTLFRKQRYEEVIHAANAFLARVPNNEEVTDIVNASWYGIGKQLLRQNKYLEALEAFESVDADYTDVQDIIGSLQETMLEVAEKHFRRGIDFYLQEKLQLAIAEWNKTLALNPDHGEAEKNITKARNLLERLQQVE